VYRPVVLKSFKTKQGVGTMDSMKFIISGEELILATGINKGGPKELEFTVVPPEEYQSLVDKLACSDIEVKEGEVLSRATVPAGSPFTTGGVTFLSKGTDRYGNTSYEKENSDIGDVVGGKGDTKGIKGISNITGFNYVPVEPEKGIGECLADAVIGAIGGVVDGYLNTTLGKLEEGIYGAKQDIINMGGPALAPLMSDGLDCLVAGATAGVETFIRDAFGLQDKDECGNVIDSGGLPTANEAIGSISDGGVAGAQDIIKKHTPAVKTGLGF